MLDDFNLTLLAGGYYHCDSSWTKAASGLDQCYKVYFPVSGEVFLEMDTGRFRIRAPRVYFISGFLLRRQVCESRMTVYWIHFVPKSLYLCHWLNQLGPVHSWSRKSADWPHRSYTEIGRIFDEPYRERNRPRNDPAPAIVCRIHGVLLMLISRLLASLGDHPVGRLDSGHSRLKPALDLMESQYRRNPPLAEIARTAHMAPNYFHRRFHQLFGTTPFNYMLARRLNEARHLLTSTPHSVKEIAEQVGYENPLYFSRVFSAQMQMSPSRYRAMNAWAPQNGDAEPASATTARPGTN